MNTVSRHFHLEMVPETRQAEIVVLHQLDRTNFGEFVQLVEETRQIGRSDFTVVFQSGIGVDVVGVEVLGKMARMLDRFDGSIKVTGPSGEVLDEQCWEDLVVGLTA